MIRLLHIVLIAGVAALTVLGCGDLGSDPPLTAPLPPPSGGTTISYRANILPILQVNGCIGCHGGSGGLFVGTVNQLLQGGIHGPAVVPGDAASSHIIQKLSTPPPFGDRMPQGGVPLPDSTIQVIRTWINQGAQDN